MTPPADNALVFVGSSFSPIFNSTGLGPITSDEGIRGRFRVISRSNSSKRRQNPNTFSDKGSFGLMKCTGSNLVDDIAVGGSFELAHHSRDPAASDAND